MFLGLIPLEGHTAGEIIFQQKGLDFEWINMLGVNGSPVVMDRMNYRVS